MTTQLPTMANNNGSVLTVTGGMTGYSYGGLAATTSINAGGAGNGYGYGGLAGIPGVAAINAVGAISTITPGGGTGMYGSVNLTASCPTVPPAVTFTGPNNEKGKLYWKDGMFHFEGDLDESAKIFCNYLNDTLLMQILSR